MSSSFMIPRSMKSSAGFTVKCAAVSAILLMAMPARSALPINAPRAAALAQLPENRQVRAALDWFSPHLGWINDEQARLTEIPAPPFHEEQRAAAVKVLLAAVGLDVQIDKTGNVIGELHGSSDKEVVVLSAHLDTVFPPGTDVKVQREAGRMIAPGISDNGTGLAALVAIARAMHEARIKPQRTILFVADVGEEGEGNLRGMRALVDTYRGKLSAVIIMDGSGTDHVTTKALASRRLEVIVTGPGGHSWSDFGIPNPINALVRASVRFINTRVPVSPRTTYNIGEIEGGTSVNSIPHEAHMKVDTRSESEEELTRLETALRDAVAAGVRDELEASRDRSKGKLDWKVNLLGSRPGGELRGDSPLLAALRYADSFVGNESRAERASTDANVPLSLGIDAVALGAGGNGGGAHSLQEWYDPSGRELGLQRALLTLLGVSGIVAEKSR